MSSSEPARLTLRSTNALLEITVVDSDFRPVASGVGSLEATVPPGIYQVVARAGPAVERRLVSLGPGEEHSASDLAVAYPSAAPVEGSATSHEYHMMLAEEVTRRAPDTGAASWCAVVVRDVRGLQGPALERSTLGRVELRDRRLQPVPGFDGGWDHRPAEGAAAWGGALEPGAYVLRTRGSERGSMDRSIWVQSGWQTVVFLTVGPSGELPAALSIHMVDAALWWSPVEDRVAEAAELASAALEEGRQIVPGELLRLLLDTKFRNPVFGLIGAHALLLGRDPDPATVSMVLNNLDMLLPGHPDVVALRWLAAERLPGIAPVLAAGAGIDWPPMLLPSYQALLRADARDSGVLRDGSFAERMATTLVMQGIWTAWRPIPAETPPPTAPSLEAAADRDGAGATGTLLADLAPTAHEMTRLAAPDPATARVARYLGSVADLEGPDGALDRFRQMTTGELALATQLPSATVERSVRELHRLVNPSGPPGPEEPDDGHDEGDGGGENGRGEDGGGDDGENGRGGAHVPLALLMAIGLLLLVGIGFAIGLVVGGDGPSPSPSPDATPTRAGTPTSSPPPTATPSPTPTPVPVPDVEVDPEELDFGVVLMDDRRDGVVTIRSVGNAPLSVIDAFIGEGGQEFGAFPEDCVGRMLEPGDSCIVEVLFSPAEPDQRVGTLIVELEELGSRIVRLSGIGEPRNAIEFDPSPADLGTDWTPIAVVALGPVRIVDVRIEGDGAGFFEHDPAGCLDQPDLGEGATCDVLARLRPGVDQGGSYGATLVVETAGGATYPVQLYWNRIL